MYLIYIFYIYILNIGNLYLMKTHKSHFVGCNFVWSQAMQLNNKYNTLQKEALSMLWIVFNTLLPWFQNEIKKNANYKYELEVKRHND